MDTNYNDVSKENLDNQDFRENKEIISLKSKRDIGTDFNYKHELVWKNIVGFAILHLLGIWGMYLFFTGGVCTKTVLWTILIMNLSCEGTTVGAHRLFTHKTFKAKPPLKAYLLALQTLAGQNCMYIWCRDHRLHHRYSDTDADPHNAKRGFFFSHIGWIMTRKHPYVKEYGKYIDLSDLEKDWMIMFQKKYYYVLYTLTAVMIPVLTPVYFFGESLRNAFLVSYLGRYVFELNATWLVNSAAHIYGTRPYNKNLQPVESWFVSLITEGEGWHNYHHSFPWDYKAAELGMPLNLSASKIRFYERIGWAYDLKTASDKLVEKRIVNYGDGTHARLGTATARARVTARGPLHPLNPTYTSVARDPDSTLTDEGLPLFHEHDYLHLDSLKRVATAAH